MTDQIAFITGASRGLGRAMALHLAATGCHVIGTYNTDANAAQKTAADITAHGVKAAMLPLNAEAEDFADFANTLAQTINETFGKAKITHLINNAGIGIHAPLGETSAAQLDQLYRIHLRTPFLLTQTLLPQISDGGHVLFVSSGLTRFTLPGHAAYASMKGAVEVMTHYAAKELAPRGIRANCIAPGAIETDFSGGAVRDNPDLNSLVAGMTALGRAGQPDDIGGAVAALLGDGMGWITGQRIEVSGGQLL